MNPRRPASWLFAVAVIFPLLAHAQSSGFDSAGRAFISGRVLLLASNFPAQRVEVRLTPISGGLPVAVLTDGEGRFQINGLHEGTYCLGVREKGYDEIQETVQVSRSTASGLTFWLKKSDAPPAEQTGPTVSVRELSIPAKARHEFHKGMERREKQDPAGSVPHFQRAIAIFPSYYEAYLQMGFADESLGQTAEAEKAIRTSVKLSDENFAEADFALCELLDNQKQFGDAEKVARHGLQLNPASWVGHFLLGEALYGMNRFKEAEESAKKVLSLKRNFASVHLLLANIHLRKHDRPALLEDLNSYLALDPDGPQAAQARHLRETVQQSLAAAAPAGNQ